MNKVRLMAARDGYIFVRKSDGEVVGRSICLGVGDSPDNYIEVEEFPKDETEEP